MKLQNYLNITALAVLIAAAFIIVGMCRSELIWVAGGALVYIVFSYSLFDALIKEIDEREYKLYQVISQVLESDDEV